MNIDQALQTFISESRELLGEMEQALLGLEEAEQKDELVNAIFRAAHTIKGSAGLFSLDAIVEFTHVVESVLDKVRAGRIAIGDALVVLLLACRDHICALIDTVETNQGDFEAALLAQGEPLLGQLRGHLGVRADPPAAADTGARTLIADATRPGNGVVERIDRDSATTDCWHISLRFGPDVLRNGLDPLSFIRYLQTLGRIAGAAIHTEALPEAGQMDPERCYLGFELALRTDADKTTIENVFEFVRDECELRILPPHSRIGDYIRLIEQQGEAARLGEMLLRCGTLTAQELDHAINDQAAHPDKLIGAILVDDGVVQPEVVEAALVRQKQVRDSGAHESRSIRIDADKLDQLINLVGELIIAGANVNQIAQRAQFADLQESTSKLSTLVQEVRDSALQLRMVRIGATFSRFQRVVHDVSRELGKDIALVIQGEDTELDKTVVEKISDPLMHLVRNAMDHGIESAALRLERGKPAQGRLELNAFHDSGSIVITVRDDGGGLRRERILAKAIERGLVEAGHTLSDSEVYGLIFEPGFSTAEQVTNLSGRGVGLDVVKRNITALRGSVEIASTEGTGTTVTVRLPLTLAIIDGFLVGAGKSVYAIPLDMIEECIAYSAEPGHDYTNLRGQVLPFIRLREIFALNAPPPRSQNIVVLKHGKQRAGLVVDRLMGEFQTVIKPLEAMFGHVKCISGSTILGSGEVALILDVPALINRCINHDKRSLAQGQGLESISP
ncbi:CheA signal transduction histidine kinase [Leptothrix cholodnii SP-6]|uniref:Chemotaxis protein CheA n=1 Tax=Leptothrix cholodnii (strain ATCC 51168 / LMG 8142 / SP-6) TaxID=395495 RepID=B1Y6M4_LEPCP|nr:chemotaxis protein CheA [Leptothrix cholodnii]ACB36052.1 CheA signal transduction histidine kinase [Leptothrix cholodnii SP-6]